MQAFKKSQEYDLDTLIIGRGGGASEDLSAFNDEKLVRAIADSKMPVIAAVGHEIDVTLVDYVADKRASTPTGAAELATVDIREIQQKFQYDLDIMKDALTSQVEDMKNDVSSLKEEMSDAIKDKIDYLTRKLKAKKDQLEALNPKSILDRGYGIITNQEGKVIQSIRDVKAGQEITTSMKDGTIISKVEKAEEE